MCNYCCAIYLDDMDIRIANKYRLGRKIGGGSFGDIYLGKSDYYFKVSPQDGAWQ